MMDRRAFIGTVVVGALMLSSRANAQPAQRLPRVAFVFQHMPVAEMPGHRDVRAFAGSLRDLGWIEGRNIVIDYRSTEGRVDQMPRVMQEVLASPVAVIVSLGHGVIAARRLTDTVPIVAVNTDLLVELGGAASLARPGGNVTGIFLDFPELGGKWLELVKQLTPRASRVAVLWDPVTGRVPLDGAEASARSLRLQLHVHEARGPGDFEAVFRAAVAARAEALVILSSPMFNTYRRQLIELAAKHRVPAIMPFPLFADDGGLIAYGPDLVELYRQGGAMVGRVLKGARPAELPVERPSRFVLAVNTRTARALGLTFPQSILIRADKVIQ